MKYSILELGSSRKMSYIKENKVLLEASNVSGDYVLPESTVHAVEKCSLTMRRGDVVGLAGESGCGKSTFGKLLLGYNKPPLRLSSGSVKVDGVDIYSMGSKERSQKVWGTKISRVPQYSMNSLTPVDKIKKIVKDFMQSKNPGISERESASIARKQFEEVGLDADILERYSFELSGGMKQRAVIVISLLLNPSVLIADEPTTALDVSTQRRLIEFMYNLIKKGIIPSMIFISHDIATLKQICDYMCIMYAGEMVESGRMVDVINDPLHPYTKLLINTVPSISPETKKTKLKDIPGFPPDLREPIKGCRFYERCSSAKDVCKEKPPYAEAGRGRLVRCWLK